MVGVLLIMVAEGNSHGGPLRALFGTDTYHFCPCFIGQSKLRGHSRVQQSNCVSCLHREGRGGESKPETSNEHLPQMELQLILIISELNDFALILCTTQIFLGMFRFVFVSFDEPVYCLR